MNPIKSFIFSFFALFVAIDAIAVLPIFISITENLKSKERKKVMQSSIRTASLVAVGFILFGKIIFWVMGISIEDFKIAGGILLLVLSIYLLLSEKQKRLWSAEMGIFPLGTPLLVGPAVLTTLLILIDSRGLLVTVLAFVSNMALVVVLFNRSATIMKFLGPNGIKAVSKVMDIILSAFGVMLIRKGILEIFKINK